MNVLGKTIINEEDHTLLRSFMQGENAAFSSIYNKYVDELFIYGVGLGFEREVIKDAIQDTFFKFYINKKHLKNIVHLKYYLYRMLKNRLLDIHKSTGNEIPGIPELPFIMEPSIIEELITREDNLIRDAKIEQLLNVLTGRQREAVYLRFIRELEYEEVANLLDMTPHAVRKLVSRAIKRMREESF